MTVLELRVDSDTGSLLVREKGRGGRVPRLPVTKRNSVLVKKHKGETSSSSSSSSFELLTRHVLRPATVARLI